MGVREDPTPGPRPTLTLVPSVVRSGGVPVQVLLALTPILLTLALLLNLVMLAKGVAWLINVAGKS